jgi:TonB family protein
LKKGFEGTVLLNISIDENGIVTNVEIVDGIHPVLDAIAIGSASQLLFAPALENGVPVPVIIQYQYTFDIKHILQSYQSTFNFTGTVTEKGTDMPLHNIPVKCTFLDTTADTDLSIPFTHYIKQIAQIPGQGYADGKLITHTDSLGRFKFSLLPVCSLKICINFLQHDLFLASESILSGEVTNVSYAIAANKAEGSGSEYEIIVSGKKSAHERLSLCRKIKYGFCVFNFNASPPSPLHQWRGEQRGEENSGFAGLVSWKKNSGMV